MLDYGPVLPALDSPWCVEEIGGDSPQGYKQPAPPRQAIIAWCRSLALRTAPADAVVRLHGDLDGERSIFVPMHAHLLVDEPYETLYLIQDGLNLELNS